MRVLLLEVDVQIGAFAFERFGMSKQMHASLVFQVVVVSELVAMEGIEVLELGGKFDMLQFCCYL